MAVSRRKTYLVALISELEKQTADKAYCYWIHSALQCTFVGSRLSDSLAVEAHLSGCPTALSRWIRSQAGNYLIICRISLLYLCFALTFAFP